MQKLAPYARVKEFLRSGLSVGQWKSGDLMPSDSALGLQFGVSRMTVIRALRELQTEGLVRRAAGIGTYAADLGSVPPMLPIRDLHEEIVARGGEHRSRLVLATVEPVFPGLETQLGLAIGKPVFHTQILHYENEVPLQFEDRYVNPISAPDYLKNDFSKITPTNYLLRVAPKWEAQYTVEATVPTQQEAQQLGIAVSTPCLVIVRRTMHQNIPITLVRLVHPGASFRLNGRFKP